MPRNTWTIQISGAGENRNAQTADVDALLDRFVAALERAGHQDIGHRITYDQREVAVPSARPLAEVLGRAAPSSVPHVLDQGGVLTTDEGVRVPIVPGSVAVATGARPDGTTTVAIARNGRHIGTGTVTLPDGSALTQHGSAWSSTPR